MVGFAVRNEFIHRHSLTFRFLSYLFLAWNRSCGFFKYYLVFVYFIFLRFDVFLQMKSALWTGHVRPSVCPSACLTPSSIKPICTKLGGMVLQDPRPYIFSPIPEYSHFILLFFADCILDRIYLPKENDAHQPFDDLSIYCRNSMDWSFEFIRHLSKLAIVEPIWTEFHNTWTFIWLPDLR